MKKVQFYGFSHTTGYNGRGGLWEDGETRTVGGKDGLSQDDATYLCDTFPDAFGEPKPEPEPADVPPVEPDPERAHNDDGIFKADDPSTPDVDESVKPPKGKGKKKKSSSGV